MKNVPAGLQTVCERNGEDCDQFDGPPDESQEDQTAEKNVCSRARAQESSEGSIALFRTGLLAIVFLSG